MAGAAAGYQVAGPWGAAAGAAYAGLKGGKADKEQKAMKKQQKEYFAEMMKTIRKYQEIGGDQYDLYKDYFQPVEKLLAEQAQSGQFDAPESVRQDYMDRASADVMHSFSKQRKISERNMAKAGIDPSEGRGRGEEQKLVVRTGAKEAGAMTQAARDADTDVFNKRTNVAGMGGDILKRGVDIMGKAYGGFGDAYQTVQGQRQETENKLAGDMSAISSAGAFMPKSSRSTGSNVPAGQESGDYDSNRADGGSMGKYGYADGGGAVAGPGGPVDDEVGANVPEGAYVIPADVVETLGVDFFDKLEQDSSGTKPGTEGMVDRIRAKLSNGEYVMSPSTVQRKGRKFFDDLVEKYHTPAAEQSEDYQEDNQGAQAGEAEQQFGANASAMGIGPPGVTETRDPGIAMADGYPGHVGGKEGYSDGGGAGGNVMDSGQPYTNTMSFMGGHHDGGPVDDYVPGQRDGGRMAVPTYAEGGEAGYTEGTQQNPLQRPQVNVQIPPTNAPAPPPTAAPSVSTGATVPSRLQELQDLFDGEASGGTMLTMDELEELNELKSNAAAGSGAQDGGYFGGEMGADAAAGAAAVGQSPGTYQEVNRLMEQGKPPAPVSQGASGDTTYTAPGGDQYGFDKAGAMQGMNQFKAAQAAFPGKDLSAHKAAAKPQEMGTFNAGPVQGDRIAMWKASRAHRLGGEQYDQAMADWNAPPAARLPGVAPVVPREGGDGKADGGHIGKGMSPKKKTRRGGRKNKKKFADGGEPKSKEQHKKEGTRPKAGDKGKPQKPIEGSYGANDHGVQKITQTVTEFGAGYRAKHRKKASGGYSGDE